MIDQMVLIEVRSQVDRMLIKLRHRDLVETSEVVNDLLDMRALLDMATPKAAS